MAELQQKSNTKQYNEELEELDQLLTETIIRIKKSKQLIHAIVNELPLEKDQKWENEIIAYKQGKIERVKQEMRQENASFDFDTDFIQVKTRREKRTPKKKKKSTYETTLELLNAGKSIKEVAKERQLSSQTITSHCERLLKTEKIELRDLLEAKRINQLSDVFDDYDGGSLTELKEKVGRKFTWDELKLYRASLIV